MRWTFLPLLFGFAVAAVGRPDASASGTALFDGKDFSGWEFVTPHAVPIATVCHYHADGSMSLAGKPLGYLATTQRYRNFILHAEWRWAAKASPKSNSGILVHIATGPKDRVWPVCFQVQTKLGRAGDLLPMAGATMAEKLSTPPGAAVPQLFRQAASSEKPAGEWNSCDIECRDGTIEITVNGVRQNRVTQVKPDAGQVGFQFEGWPYELRNARITVLP